MVLEVMVLYHVCRQPRSPLTTSIIPVAGMILNTLDYVSYQGPTPYYHSPNGLSFCREGHPTLPRSARGAPDSGKSGARGGLGCRLCGDFPGGRDCGLGLLALAAVDCERYHLTFGVQAGIIKA